MRIDLLPDAGGLEAEWWDLWRRDPAATPFQSPAWLLPWRRHFGDGASLVVTIRDGGRLAGLLPLFEHDGRWLPWGAGTSDWLDGLFDPALPPDVLTEAVGRLSMPLDLFQLPAGSMLLRIAAPGGWSSVVDAAESCAVLPLPACPSAGMARRLRYYRRRAERAGIGPPQTAGPEEIEALAALHTRRWNRKDDGGIFADPRMLGWLREALPTLEAHGLCRLYALRAGPETVAALLVLRARRTTCYYIGGFDPDLSTLGLGTILVGHAIDEATRAGHAAFDFLRGREPYKYRWGAEDRPALARLLAPPGSPER